MRFHKPEGWQGRTVADSPIVNSWPEVWQSLESVYLEELPDLAYKEIPPADDIEKSMRRLLAHLKKDSIGKGVGDGHAGDWKRAECDRSEAGRRSETGHADVRPRRRAFFLIAANE